MPFYYAIIDNNYQYQLGGTYMKKLLVISLCLTLFLSACGSSENKSESKVSENKTSSTQIFKQDDGKRVRIPKNPKKIVVLHPTYIGALIKFGHKPIGVSEFVKQNKTLNKATKGIERIGQGNIEQVIKLKPDLIITTKEDKNSKKLQKVAPTVQLDAMKSNYKRTTKSLSQIVNEQDKAEKWLKDWEKKLQKDKKELSNKVKGKTITAIQATPKGISAFSSNYGRGTEIVYDGYGMKQPKLLEKKTKNAYMTILSEETLSDYTGDYIILATLGEKPPFTEKENWKNIEAVKNGRVINLDLEDTQYNDPISLEKQRKIIYQQLKEIK